MANSKLIPVGEHFDLNEVAAQISRVYTAKGYSVSAFPIGAGISMEFIKNDSFFYNAIGLVSGIKVNLFVVNGVLNVNFSDEKWADKIIAFVLGWFCCWITWVTGGIGVYNQYQLSSNLANDITMFAIK